MRLPQQSAAVFRSVSPLAVDPRLGVLPQSCPWYNQLGCAAILVACGAPCCFGLCVYSPLCIACMGGFYAACSDCF